ncbi:hypothetical protein WR25_01881 isoform B [Diploscapter pachys]|nr:hypothetical protein WR25_01881 isoform B [Diploscapter pachys]
MSSPYDPPQPHQSFQNYGQQQHRGGFQHRGRGRGHHNEWQGQEWRGNGQAQGYGRGNRQNWRGNYQQQQGYQGQNRGGGQARGKQDDSMYTVKDYVIPAMTCNPWAELERQRKREQVKQAEVAE